LTQLILLADGQASRRRRLVDAFHASDVEVEAVGDGASALELALSERPELVVAETELPLVEAPKLAEILRANPRTRAARFVFMGGGSRTQESAGLSDVFLPREASIADIVSAARAEFAIQKRLSELNRVVERQERLCGRFPDLPLLEVMHCLHVWQCSGRLDIRCTGKPDGCGRASVWLLEGQVVDAELGDAQGRKALYRLMGWDRGEFVLDPTGMPAKRRPLAPLRPLLREGTRQLTELGRLADQLPPWNAAVALRVHAAELPSILHPLTQEVLSLLEQYDMVGDVVDHCSYPDYQVLRTLGTLADRQILEFGTDAVHGGGETGLFDAQQIRRLSEWALIGPVQSSEADLKLLVAASCPSALADFVGLLGSIPGVSLSPGFDSGAADVGSLEPIGRLDNPGGIGIEFVNVPTGEDMAPLWPVVGSGALGTLFVLSGAVAEAASRVQPMVDALRRQPRNRMFNLYLYQKGEAISPAELGENLSLIDEASLFVLQLEGGKSPAALLRRVFARVVP
jgi:CheY-like chemotaxis protein